MPTQPTKYISFTLNTLGLLSNISVLYAVHFLYVNPFAQGFGGHFQYLTILGLLWATVAFAINMVRCFQSNALAAAYEVVYHIATPLEALISIMYWTMVYLDPELLVPKGVEPIPFVVDAALHLSPAVLLWTDFLLLNQDFKRSWRHAGYIFVFAISYYLWSWLCQTQNGYWPYPFLDAFKKPWERIAFYFGSGTISWIVYETGALIHAAKGRAIGTSKLKQA
ncbi:FAR-17a/AIG1-like protein [Gongronella butleri]|nr:FAR-17a/AIG1-like protein [Gongronella butleri]